MADTEPRKQTREPRPRGVYGVRLTRGPFVRLAANKGAVETPKELASLVRAIREAKPDALIAADLFSGAGGLSLGLDQAGITTVFAVDHDKEAVETHRHHFPGMTVDWDLADGEVVDKVGALLKRLKVDVLAGGPPCQPFSKAGRSGIRHHVRSGQRDAHDRRRDLWRSYMEIVRIARPRAVIMENVPDMALDREMFILRTMVLELEQMGYSVEERVVDTWRYGVPQFRQRLILVALRDRTRFLWPKEVEKKTTLDNAIGDLPPVEGGWRPEGGAEGWAQYDGPATAFQKSMRKGVRRSDVHKLFDHITRPVRDDDRKIFEMMDTNTRYSDLPEEFKRYRDDIFDDKYKRLNANDLSRTITAHIAKDGYWYIHPTESRTITIREAARIQTFPDWFRFAGPPSAAFRQIGNAVPPMLGTALGKAVRTALENPVEDPYSSEEIADVLAAWFHRTEFRVAPWLKSETRWQVISGETLLDKSTTEHIKHIWPLLRRWKTPAETSAAAEELSQLGTWIGRGSRADRLLTMAAALAGESAFTDDALEAAKEQKVLPDSVADVAMLAVPVGLDDESEEPVIINKGVLRVASRFVGQAVDRRNRLTDGRMAVARMIGYGKSSRPAHLALMELSMTVCRPTSPDCPACPLAAWCVSSRTDALKAERLF